MTSKKVAFISDTHIGCRSDSELFHDNMELFFDKVFFPNLEKYDVKRVYHLGDVFDNRRRLSSRTAERSRKYFFEPMANKGIPLSIIAGNHDVYYRESNDTNHLVEFIQPIYEWAGNKSMLNIYTECDEFEEFFLVPWINKNNREETIECIQQTDKKWCLGHLELSGFNFSKIQVSNHGDDPNIFNKFERVFSGHYHYFDTKGNITYLGCPTEHTWINCKTFCGFHIFDVETAELTSIYNPNNMFDEGVLGDNCEGGTAKYYRIRVPADSKQSDVQKYEKKLLEAGAHEVKMLDERVSAVITKDSGDAIITVEDTPTFISNTVDVPEVASILIDIYNEAVREV